MEEEPAELLEQALTLSRRAAGLIPKGHPDEARHFNNLAGKLLSRFERLGEMADLEAGIEAARRSGIR